MQKSIVILAGGVSLLFFLLWVPFGPRVIGMGGGMVAFWSFVSSMSISTTLALGLKNIYLALPGALVLPFLFLSAVMAEAAGTHILAGYLFFFFLITCGALLIRSYQDDKKRNSIYLGALLVMVSLLSVAFFILSDSNG